MDGVEKLADTLFDGDFPYEYGYEWQPISRDHLRTLAREAAKIGWEEGRNTEYYIHYDNPYGTPKEPS